MPQKRRQDRQAALYVLPGPIPPHQSFHSEPMAKIVQTRTVTGIHRPQSSLPRQCVERTMDFAFVEPVSIAVHKEVCRRPQAEAAVSAFHIICQDLSRRGMQGYQTGLAELGATNGEDALGPVQILRAKVQRFPEP